ncbi:MAG TPA: phosphodiester glycosidase family protein [Terriglobales bacterium]|nr:phosphodiester glycosidase family protein [Terriglobales bacterium]
MRRFLSFALLLFPLSVYTQVAVPAQEHTCVASERTLAADVTYRQLCRSTPQGEPWSIHVLRVKRNSKAHIRAVAARNESGQMVRERPTVLANRETAQGKKVIAVVNGDYDFTTPGNMGVSIGLSVVDGHIWTGANGKWPVIALAKNGEPVIGLPKFDVRVRAGHAKFQLANMNKPLGRPEAGLLLTSEFRSQLTTGIPVQSFVVGRLSVTGPLPIDREIAGRVTSLNDARTDTLVPRDALTVVLPKDTTLAKIRRNDRVKVKITATVEGRPVHHAIGGFPVLVRDGKRSVEGEPGENLRKRHPRTAVCYNQQEVIFTVVDGRQPKLSVGMNLEELADLMVELGCQVAMNTDGGGSSVMAIAGDSNAKSVQIVNSPSDGRERGRGNAFVIEAD